MRISIEGHECQGLGNKSECNELATTETVLKYHVTPVLSLWWKQESLAEPLVRSVKSFTTNDINLCERNATDSDVDSEVSEYWDDDSSDEENAKEEKQTPKPEKTFRYDDFAVNMKGAVFGSKVKVTSIQHV